MIPINRNICIQTKNRNYGGVNLTKFSNDSVNAAFLAC